MQIHKYRPTQRSKPKFTVAILCLGINVAIIFGVWWLSMHQADAKISQTMQLVSTYKTQIQELQNLNLYIQSENDRLTKIVKSRIHDESADKIPTDAVTLGISRVGQFISGLEISAIEPIEAKEGLSTQNAHVLFSGTITITGRYTYYDTGPVNGLQGTVVFSDLDETSKRRIPRLYGRDSKIFIVFQNQELARELLGPRGGTGFATIVLDNFEINSRLDHWDTAELVKVLEKI